MAFANELCGVAGENLEGRHSSGEDTSRSGNGAFAEYGSGQQRTSGTCPGSVKELDGLDTKTKGRIAPIVIARAQVGPLRDAYVVAQPYGGKIVDPDALAYPAVIANAQMPRIFHNYFGVNDDTAAYLGSEESQQNNP